MMKKPLSWALACSILVVCLCGSVSAASINGISFSDDGEPVQIEVKNQSGEWEWVDICNAQGGLDWMETDGGWERVYDIPDAAALAGKVQAKKSELETRFGIRITDGDPSRSLLNQLRCMNNLEAALQVIPTPLYESARAKLSARGKTLTIQFQKSEGVFFYGGNTGRYTPSTVTIELLRVDGVTLAHEYGHMLQMTLLDAQYGADNLKSNWTALNRGAAYGNGSDSETFLRDYAATNYGEDFADSVSYLLANPDFVQRLAMAHPDCAAIDKVAYLRRLLSEAFLVDPAIFPDIYPSQPSPWAAAGIAEYLTLFPFGKLASAYEPFYPGYQTGATRRNFAQGAYQMVMAVWQNQYDDVHEYMDGWSSVYPEYPAGGRELNELSPFTDLSETGTMLDSTSNEAVIKLYLMGVVNGKSATAFDPEGPITRQEAAVTLYRLCTALGYVFPEAESPSFRDVDQFPDWAQSSINAVCSAGIMNGVGDGSFAPLETYSYEQSALTLVRIYHLLCNV